MKTLRALFSLACLLLVGTSSCVTAYLWQSWNVSDAWFIFVVLVGISSGVLVLTVGRRSLLDLGLAIKDYLAEKFHGFTHACHWEIADPIFWKLVQYRTLLGRRRRVVFTAVVLAALVATIIVYLIHPTFAATARMNVVTENRGEGVFLH